MRLPGADAVIARALAARACSAVTAEVGRSDGPVWTAAGGTLGFGDGTARVEAGTVFDLASLTKVLATTTLALAAGDRGTLDIERPLHDILPVWRADDRRTVSLRDLLEHASGLPAYREYFRQISGREAYAAAIASEPLEYAPRARAVYSDLGFIMLGLALEQIGGQPLDIQFNEWRTTAAIPDPLAYLPPAEWHARTAMTEHDTWRGRMLQGEVHDENAAAMGGVAAHAGLFGTAAAVGAAGRWWLQRLDGRDDPLTKISARAARAFVVRSSVPGSSRALGWDTMLPTSSCGSRLSSRAVGHTGFTGTSLWIDPEQDLYVVLLTNRVHPTRSNDAIQGVRRAFHDAVVEGLRPDG